MVIATEFFKMSLAKFIAELFGVEPLFFFESLSCEATLIELSSYKFLCYKFF